VSYTTSEHLGNCQHEVKRALLLRKHYPDAHRDKVDGRYEWSHHDALANANGFTIEVVHKLAADGSVERRAVTFLPYHELREGDGIDAVVVRVYSADWRARLSDFELIDRINARPAVRDAILEMLKTTRR
jgi:hypothetical protein